MRAPLQFGPAIALEYRTILVPIVSGPESHESIDLAARLAAERGATIVALRVIVVPLDQPIDADMAAEEDEADRLLDEARLAAENYGVRTIDRLVRARHAGRAIVEEAERRQAEIVVLGAPRGRHKAIFGKTVDYVLKNAPCRVMVAAGQEGRVMRALPRADDARASRRRDDRARRRVPRRARRARAGARSGSCSASLFLVAGGGPPLPRAAER